MIFFKLFAKRVLKPNKINSLRLANYIFQKILGVNGAFPYPIHYTSTVASPEKIKIEGGKHFFKSLEVSGNCYFSAANGIHFGHDVLLAPNVKIISANHDFGVDRSKVEARPIVIGSNVWIGTGAIILPGVQIGSNSVIAAGSVVRDDVPDFALVAGVPSKLIKYLS